MNYPYLQLPKIICSRLIAEGVDIYFYRDWESIFLEQGNGEFKRSFLQEILPLMGSELAPFRRQYVIGPMQLLCAVYPEEKTIRMGTPHLAQETFILNEAKYLLDQLDSDEVSAFGHHVQQMAILEPPTFPSDVELIAERFKLSSLVKGHQVDILETKLQLLKELRRYRSCMFEKITDRGLGLTAKYALMRVHLLKFLAILPSLDFDQSGVEVKKVLVESLRRLVADSKDARKHKKTGQFAPIPRAMEILIAIKLKFLVRFPANLLARIVRFCVRYLAKRFIAGETIEKAHGSLKKLFSSGRDATLDQLGELVVSEIEADHYRDEVIKLVRGFKQHVPIGSRNLAGINRANVSIKVSALCSDFNPAAFDYTYERVAPRLKSILLAAKEEQVYINVDAEHIHFRDMVFEIYKKLLLNTEELRDFADTGIVIQAYLQDSYSHFLQILDLAKERAMRMPIRLVKGAYWDAETIETAAHHSPSYQFLNKDETDLMFRQIAVSILENHQNLQLVTASHNYLDHSFVEAYRKAHTPDAPMIEHQCLDMTYEALSKGMAKLGWAVRNYVPVGSLLVGMAYLVRRIMENSSQVGVLTIMRSHHHDDVMKSPEIVHQEKKDRQELQRDSSSVVIDSEFHNIPPVRIYRQNERRELLSEMNSFKETGLGHLHPNLNLYSGDEVNIYSSSDSNIKVGMIRTANQHDADDVMNRAHDAYMMGEWAKARPVERASVMLRAASMMTAERNSLAMLIIFEAGKTISEALGDVDEAIDFLNFYGREEISLHRHNPQIMSKGVVVAIAPWNFPLAIPCGMIASPLVAGNAVVLKSAGQTPLIAQKLVDLLHRAGVPQNILQHIPGAGSVIGDILLNHSKLAGVVFTGSKEVGIHIAHTASNRLCRNELFNVSFPVSAITEMGGKNAIIVTGSADLDQAVSGIIYSAFGHAGQKCSAASRVIVDHRVKNRLIERLKQAITDLPVGKAFDFSTYINPLITIKETERLKRSVEAACDEAGRSKGTVHVDCSKNEYPGNCLGPVLIELTADQAMQAESYACRELFGPILHIIGYSDLEQAISIFNVTEYALTGGVFSQSQDEIDWLSNKMEVGNVYINRPITGARVNIEPFGGFKLSGTGPKAGGKDYLPRFHIDCSKNYEGQMVEGQRGSDYKFRCSLPSTDTHEERVRKIIHALKLIDARFETIFTGVFGGEKAQLRQLVLWIEKNYLSLRNGFLPNLYVPGQESYNDYKMQGECVLVVSVNRIPEFSNFVHFIFSLMSGAGLTVLVRNDISFKWWTRVANILFEVGISKSHFDLYFCTEPLLVSALRTPYLTSVIIDGDQQFISDVLKVAHDHEAKPKRLKAFYTHLDRPQDQDFMRYALAGLWVRSFAVNKMRHGAPLEIE